MRLGPAQETHKRSDQTQRLLDVAIASFFKRYVNTRLPFIQYKSRIFPQQIRHIINNGQGKAFPITVKYYILCMQTQDCLQYTQSSRAAVPIGGPVLHFVSN